MRKTTTFEGSVPAEQALRKLIRERVREVTGIAVETELEEAGVDLLTFTRYPQGQWSVLRTTNHIERLNGEFRRRTRTQGSFASEQGAVVLLWALVAHGQVGLQKIRGHREMPKATGAAKALSRAA